MKIRTFDLQTLPRDILTGVVIAFVSIPISMGYASVAGLPVIFGLYGSLAPILLFGLITSSPRFVFGVDAAPAALVGGLIASLGIVRESEEAVAVIPLLTFMVAIWLFLFFLVQADRILKYISQSVMGGFITGIGLVIISMQIPKLFGGTAGSGELPELFLHIVEEARAAFNLPSLMLGLGTIAVLLISKKKLSGIPIQIAVMFAGMGLTYFAGIDRRFGIATLPAVQAGLPPVIMPRFDLLGSCFSDLLVPSLTIALVIFSETLLATTNIGLKYGDRIRPRREILAYAAGNLAASLAGCLPVNGSVSRTGIADQYGVKSQAMSVTASVTMALILLFGTDLIRFLPVPVLTAIVIAALIGTLEFDLARRLGKVDRAEGVIFFAAMLSVLFFGTIYGVIVGVLLSSITFITRQARPATAFLGIIEGDDGFHSLKRIGAAAAPIRNVVIYRFTGALFYATIDQFCADIEAAVEENTKVIIVDSSGIGSVDVTAAERLLVLFEQYRDRGIRFYLAGHAGHVNDELRAFGAGELIRQGAVRSRITLALKASGIRKPYDLDEDKRPPVRRFRKELAEFTWAFGEEAPAMMQAIAHRLAAGIAEKGMPGTEELYLEERRLALGYWSYEDELELLNQLETEIHDLTARGKIVIPEEVRIDEEIKARRKVLRNKIGRLSHDMLQNNEQGREMHE